MAFIELQADLKRTNELLERLTRVLERWMLLQTGVAMGHCAEPLVDPQPKVKGTVEYATDQDTITQKLKKFAQMASTTPDEEVWMDE